MIGSISGSGQSASNNDSLNESSMLDNKQLLRKPASTDIRTLVSRAASACGLSAFSFESGSTYFVAAPSPSLCPGPQEPLSFARVFFDEERRFSNPLRYYCSSIKSEEVSAFVERVEENVIEAFGAPLIEMAGPAEARRSGTSLLSENRRLLAKLRAFIVI